MYRSDTTDRRTPRLEQFAADLIIIGGGLAGTCCAITAARAGLKVVLIGDRPVLGGNCSSEVRLWVLGATSHMGNNNRWAREGGVVDELLTENIYRNREGNPVLVDPLLLEMVTREPNIRLLLNTAVFDLDKSDADTIKSVRAFCSQNSTMYEVTAPLFCDASGDGIVGFLAGAAFRIGAEAADEYGEKLAPGKEYGELLGHSMYFYSKDVGRPVRFTPPSFALDDIATKIPRFRRFNTRQHGCELWWIEYGGRLDTVHATEEIKWELWRVVYGVWNYIKNSGQFPDAATKTLEWVGTIPGKRESRRFEGDYMLSQRDLVEQRRHDDDVSFGGWAMDLHPADGVYSDKPGCNQWHSQGVFPIPYRCLYSRNITNLFLAGRIISASHVAFGSTRVMATCAHAAQAVAVAAALCTRDGVRPRQITEPGRMRQLQQTLLTMGQHIPHVALNDDRDLARAATVTVSSELRLSELPPTDAWLRLESPWAMLVPCPAGRVPKVTLRARAVEPVDLTLELRTASRVGNFTPDHLVARRVVSVRAGALASVAVGDGPNGSDTVDNQDIQVDFNQTLDSPRYVFICLPALPGVEVQLSDMRLTGVLAVTQQVNDKVAEAGAQAAGEALGIDNFAFWIPKRRPGGQNLAVRFDPPLAGFGPLQLLNGVSRPTTIANAWIADPADESPSIELAWNHPRHVGRIELSFDTDFDHPMESVLFGHPESVMPFCVRRFRVLDGLGRELYRCDDNHTARRRIVLDPPVVTDRLRIEVEHPSPLTPAAVFDVRCYEDADARIVR